MNHSVIIVSTVEEGLKASETNLDIAIIDYFLDDGEALPIIDNLLRNNKDCRLIVHTGSSSLELRKKLKFRGVRQIISRNLMQSPKSKQLRNLKMPNQPLLS